MIRKLITIALATFALSAFAAVDVNQASQAELESVKGIGPGLSGKIMAARQGSSFKDWTDFVDRVSGIGPGNAGRFSQAGLTVGGKAYVAGADGATPTDKPAKAEKAEKADKADRRSSRKAAEARPQ
jgi:competence protein ComEA